MLKLKPLRAEAAAARAEAGAALPSGYRDPLTWAIAVTACCVYTTISVFRLLQLNPTSYDLAVLTEGIKGYAHLHAASTDAGGIGTTFLGGHFSPVLILLAPFFRVFPTPATLLVAQALLTAVSVFPVAAAARDLLGPVSARIVALCYVFSWGLQQLVNFDFHEIAFAVPLLAFSVSALLRGRIRQTVLWAAPLVFVKEDQGFTVAVIGFCLLVPAVRARQPDRLRVRAGAFLVLWGIAWSVIAIAWIIPHFNAAHTYAYWSLDGGAFGLGGHSSAGAIFAQFFADWPGKLGTTIFLLLPVAFLPLWSPVALIAVPSLALRFISADPVYWGTGWHYNATVMPILFLAAIDGLRRLRSAPTAADGADGGGWRAAWQRHAVAMMLAVAVPMSFDYPLSRLWNAQTYVLNAHMAAADAAMALVPDGATVLSTLGELAPLAARCDAFYVGTPGNPVTQYVLLDAPPDQVAGWMAGYLPGVYRQIYANDSVFVFKRTDA
jgi:uncharacterized membrane protein